MTPIRTQVTISCRGWDKTLKAHVYKRGVIELCIDVDELALQMCGCMFNKRKRAVRSRGAIVAKAVSTQIQEPSK